MVRQSKCWAPVALHCLISSNEAVRVGGSPCTLQHFAFRLQDLTVLKSFGRNGILTLGTNDPHLDWVAAWHDMLHLTPLPESAAAAAAADKWAVAQRRR